MDRQVNMIRHAANPVAFAIEATRRGREVGVQVWAKFVVELRDTVLGGKDDVEEDMGEGLRHGEMMTGRGAYVRLSALAIRRDGIPRPTA